jgi:hypothetical protein
MHSTQILNDFLLSLSKSSLAGEWRCSFSFSAIFAINFCIAILLILYFSNIFIGFKPWMLPLDLAVL